MAARGAARSARCVRIDEKIRGPSGLFHRLSLFRFDEEGRPARCVRFRRTLHRGRIPAWARGGVMRLRRRQSEAGGGAAVKGEKWRVRKAWSMGRGAWRFRGQETGDRGPGEVCCALHGLKTLNLQTLNSLRLRVARRNPQCGAGPRGFFIGRSVRVGEACYGMKAAFLATGAVAW